VTRAEFEKQLEERRKIEMTEADRSVEVIDVDKVKFGREANERSTGKRALQAAAAISMESENEQAIAKV